MSTANIDLPLTCADSPWLRASNHTVQGPAWLLTSRAREPAILGNPLPAAVTCQHEHLQPTFFAGRGLSGDGPVTTDVLLLLGDGGTAVSAKPLKGSSVLASPVVLDAPALPDLVAELGSFTRVSRTMVSAILTAVP